jgi:hypothetical protein
MPNIPSLPKMPQLPDSVRFAAALGQFSESMKRLSHLQTQTSNRLSKLIRLGMIALVTLFAAMFVMMFTMAQRINLLVDNVAAINIHFHNMVPDISRMHSNMIKMQSNMNSMDTMPAELSKMLTQLDQMHLEVSDVRKHVGQMQYQTQMIADKTQIMAGQLYQMEPSIQHIQHNVGKTARPMRIFNQFVPRP